MVPNPYNPCAPSNPYIKPGTDTTKAPQLRYDLPQDNVYEGKLFIEFEIPDEFWETQAFHPPVNNVFELAQGMNVSALTSTINAEINGTLPVNRFLPGDLLKFRNTPQPPPQLLEIQVLQPQMVLLGT